MAGADMTWLFPAATVFSLVYAAISLAYVVTPQRRVAKKPIRFVGFLSALWMAGTYGAASLGLGSQIYLLRSGMVAAVGVIAVMSLLVAEVIADWRRE